MTKKKDRQRAPRRGGLLPRLEGIDLHGHRVSSRDYYMRRNLAVVFTGHDDVSTQWIDAAAEIADAAAEEAGQVLLVVPRGVDPQGLPVIVDADGRCRELFGLGTDDLPALFVADRYGTVFAASHGEEAIPELTPRDIPRWLEFVACRCS